MMEATRPLESGDAPPNDVGRRAVRRETDQRFATGRKRDLDCGSGGVTADKVILLNMAIFPTFPMLGTEILSALRLVAGV
jgi:hypothetical protein